MTPPSPAGSPRTSGEDAFPRRLTIAGTLRQTLRYGENPHQAAGFYVNGVPAGGGDRAPGPGQRIVATTISPTPTRRSNASPSSMVPPWRSSSTPIRAASLGGIAGEAWDLAFRCDPISPFGGIVAVNRTLDEAAAEKIAKILTEVIVAPDATEAAIAVVLGGATSGFC